MTGPGGAAEATGKAAGEAAGEAAGVGAGEEAGVVAGVGTGEEAGVRTGEEAAEPAAPNPAARESGAAVLGNVVISKNFLRTRKIYLGDA